MKETKRLKKELRTLEINLAFLDDFPEKVENMLRNLGEFGGCNMYVNYTELKLDVRDSIYHFYRTLRSQMISDIERCKKEYLGACNESAAKSLKTRRIK
jgi:hypothetical protein